jgi:hypothetical protein
MKPMDRVEMHAMLDNLMDAAEAAGGSPSTPALLGFAAMLASKVGVAERLHAAGMEEVRRATERAKTKTETADERKDRIRRGYNIAVLLCLIADVARLGNGTLLPPDFDWAPLCGDLMMMLGGKYGTGGGHPSWRGDHWLRAAARDRFVYAIVYEAARRECSEVSLLSEFGAPDLNGKTWADMRRKAPLASAAQEAGKTGEDPERWTIPADKLPRVLELIKTAKREKDVPSDSEEAADGPTC